MAKQRKKSNSKKKSARQPNNQSSIINHQSPKVWRIFHFKERFELPDDMRGFRVSGLQYTKRFVGVAGGDEAVGYQNQFAMLQNGDGLEACLLEGIYGMLVNLTAQNSRAKRERGYLIDADDKPLSDAQIGKLLNINARTMGKYLRLFETVKLLEKVEFEGFDMSLNNPPPKKKSDDSRSSDSKKQASRGQKAGNSEVVRSSPEKSGKSRAPLKKRQNGKNQNERKRVKEQKATHGLTAGVAKEKENDKAHRHRSNAQDKNQSRAQVKDEPPSAPTTTPPSEPQVSDDPGGSQVIPFPAPRTSLDAASGRQRPAMAAVAGGYDKHDEMFGQRVYVALGYRHEISSPEGRREICSFASKWAQARASLARLPPEVVDELGMRVIAEARKIARRGRRNTKPGAVMNTVIDKLVTARLREAM